jgi:hypothetical protein
MGWRLVKGGRWIPASLDQILRCELNFSVVVAMARMRMMQVAIYEVIHMISMRHTLMTAVRSMNVGGLVGSAIVFRCAGCRILSIGRNHVVVDMVVVHVVQVSIVKIIGVSLMA